MAIPALGYDYEADALADGVLHYWPMYDVGQNALCTDIIGSENITVYNDASNLTLVQDMFGYCRDLTINGIGSNHSVIVHAADTANSTSYMDWTVAVWFDPDLLATARNSTILDMTSGDGFVAYFAYPSSVVTFYVQFTGASPDASLVVSPATGTNHLLIISSDTVNGTKVYLDNVLVGSDANYQTLQPYDKRWYVGDSSSSTSSTEYLDGRVDELAIFDHELDATDRATLWNAGAGLVNSLVKYANLPRVLQYEGFGVADVVKFNFGVVASDILGGSVVNSGSLVALAEATDTPDVSDTVTAVMRALPVAGDEVGLEGAFIGNIRTGREVSEDLGFITSFSVDGEIYDGVVMNTQNNAVTEYDSVPYNSMAQLDRGVYAACAGDGIYYMDGDLDDTDNIDAYITTKLTNFGESKFKRMERAYVAMSNNGPMVLKVITRNAQGALVEDWYELENTSDTIRTDRIKVGKGLKSHYWQFVLTNKDGADFDLSELNFKQIKLSRRI
jgi:hypothetical protein